MIKTHLMAGIFVISALNLLATFNRIDLGNLSQLTLKDIQLQYAATPTPSVDERLAKIEVQVEELNKDPKIPWEPLLGLLGTIITGGVVTLIGFRLTHTYNKSQQASEQARNARQTQISIVQAVQTFMPFLQSEAERDRKNGLTAIAALGNIDLAIELAGGFGGPAAISWLWEIAIATLESSPDKDTGAKNADKAEKVLAHLFANHRSSVVKVRPIDKLEEEAEIQDLSDRNFYRGSGFFADDQGLVVCSILSALIDNDNYYWVDSGFEMELREKLDLGKYPSYIVLLDIDNTPHRNFNPLSISADVSVAHSGEIFLLIPTRGIDWVIRAARIVESWTLELTGSFRGYTASTRKLPPSLSYIGVPAIDRYGNVIGIVAEVHEPPNTVNIVTVNIVPSSEIITAIETAKQGKIEREAQGE